MTKKELQAELDAFHERLRFRCIHGHNGYSHRNCWKAAYGIKDKIGFFDIETSDLNGDWGFVLSYCLKPQNGKMIKRALSPEEVTSDRLRDHRLIRLFAEDVRGFDSLVVYYGKDTGGRYQRHDIPFMRTRFEYWGHNGFPKQREISIIDLYDIVKSKFKLKRNSMEYACKFLGIESKATPHDFGVWQRARDGNQAALNHVLKHCAEDVKTTEDLYDRIYQYKRVKVLI